jgi:hypothetical protein
MTGDQKRLLEAAWSRGVSVKKIIEQARDREIVLTLLMSAKDLTLRAKELHRNG